MLDIKAIIFDMDGVIVDSEPLHEKAQRIVFDEYNLTVPSSLFGTFKGKTEEDVFGYVVREDGRNGLDASELIALKHQVYSGLMDDLRLIDGARRFIERLAAAGVPLGLTTSATRRDQAGTFALFGLQPYFKAVVTADDVSRPKPDPEPYRTTAKLLGVAPSGCLVIEDTINGVLAAQGAGCTVAGLTTSFTAEPLRQAGAHLTIAHFDDLTPHLPWGL